MRQRKATEMLDLTSVVEHRLSGCDMKFRSFKHNFHDSQLAGFALGPRRELSLEIAIDPAWNKGSAVSTSVRFGGIENFDEVVAFFDALPLPRHPDAYIAEFIGIQYAGEGPNWAVVDLDRHGHITVKSQHVSET